MFLLCWRNKNAGSSEGRLRTVPEMHVVGNDIAFYNCLGFNEMHFKFSQAGGHSFLQNLGRRKLSEEGIDSWIFGHFGVKKATVRVEILEATLWAGLRGGASSDFDSDPT